MGAAFLKTVGGVSSSAKSPATSRLLLPAPAAACEEAGCALSAGVLLASAPGGALATGGAAALSSF